MILRRFKINKELLSQITEEDKKVLKILEATIVDIAKVYEQQIKEGFYPKGITKEQLEKESKKNPQILSPYSVVVSKNDKLEVIPYHIKYQKELIPISETIEKAAKTTSNISFKKYLKAQARSLIDGSFDKAVLEWFNVKNSNIDFSIGPFERYLDKVFFTKRAFQGHIGIIDRKETSSAEQIREVLYTSAKMNPEKYHSTDIPKRGVRVFAEDTPATAGYMADVLFSGEYFPSDDEFLKKYGSIIIVYQSQLTFKYEKLYLPIFRNLFEKRFASKYSPTLLKTAAQRNILLFTLGKQLHRFEGARERLKELYGIIDEANSFASGIQHSKYLVVKGLLSDDEFEGLIIMHIVWMFADWLLYQNNKGKESHVIGNSILLNSYLKNGALRAQNGISWPNFSRMFFEVEEMADRLVYLLRYGTYEEAQKFIKENADLKNFERLSENLREVRFDI